MVLWAHLVQKERLVLRVTPVFKVAVVLWVLLAFLDLEARQAVMEIVVTPDYQVQKVQTVSQETLV